MDGLKIHCIKWGQTIPERNELPILSHIWNTENYIDIGIYLQTKVLVSRVEHKEKRKRKTE